MKRASLRKLEALEQDAMPPEPEPDFTGWTRREIVDWQIARMARMDLATVQEAPGSFPPSPLPSPREQFAAEDARDDAILAERAAKAAAERAARDPDDEAARTAALEARETADKAVRAAEEAERLAEEARLRPPPVENPDAPGSGAAAELTAGAEPERPPPPAPEPEPAPEPKQWWEERAHWRRRSPLEEQDARRGRPMYRCLVDYDPIEYFFKEQEELAKREEEEEG